MGAAPQKLLLKTTPWFSSQPQWQVGSCLSRHQAPSEPEPRQGTACSDHAASILPVPARPEPPPVCPKNPFSLLKGFEWNMEQSTEQFFSL